MVIEFAFVTPVLLLIMLSCMDLGRLILAYQKTQVTANTIGDLVSRAEPSENTETGICSSLAAANFALRPFVLQGTDSISVSSITIEGQGGGAVTVVRDWQASVSGSGGSCTVVQSEQSLAAVPMGLVTDLEENETDNIIYTQVNFVHEAWFWSFLDTDPAHPILRQSIHKPRVAPLSSIASG
ncbi:MAG: hypothetical protein GVY13_14245 [Alphaproteobacteria bacterium]|jgi:Flp pilus assembly protein TadG|nr:hypothetical protein [Alphaproteobacteria bacterium]